MENKMYSWKYGNSKIDPNMVGEQFAAIEARDGKLTKKAIVDAARPEESPMHRMFEWDDAVAGELYREDQAHGYIRSLEVKIVPVGNFTNGKAVTMRAYVNVTPASKNATEHSGTFVNAQRAIESPDTYAIVLERAKRELMMFRDKYKDLKELSPLFAAIDQIAMEV